MRADLTLPVRSDWRSWWPEAIVGLLAGLIFLGFLGSLELWGKREQRASAEALDTVEHQRWLVARIQGRPRLEKPPLPRWAIAAVISLTGRSDEGIARLPGALSGLATVVLIYALGARIGGRTLALTATMILCTMALFVSESRQAGNDGPLGLFTTLALYAAWRRLHGATPEAGHATGAVADDPAGSRGWALLFHVALGLGFLCKGPVILLLIGFTVIPYLLVNRQLRTGARRLVSVSGILLFLVLALSWPIPVLLGDPNALGVWTTEMGQKTGLLPIGHQERVILGLALPFLALPWPVLALAGVFLPFVPNHRIKPPWDAQAVWFPWSWAIGNLAMFSTWAVAKPNYFLPCLPGLALLAGMAWIRLSLAARDRASSWAALVARALVQVQLLIVLLLGIVVALLCRWYFTAAPTSWLMIITAVMSCGVLLGLWCWRSGSDALVLAPIMAASTTCVLIGYGFIAPIDNPVRGHRHLAAQLQRLVPRGATTVHFLHEIDEGLWFYFRDHSLAPVPGSQARYSDSFDKLTMLISEADHLRAALDSSVEVMAQQQQVLREWLSCQGRDDRYLLMRTSLYERVSSEMAGLVTPVFQEWGVKRNPVILLRVPGDQLRVAVEAYAVRSRARRWSGPRAPLD
jgi:4-amino-4-deoxy-L-arabinose transferase-like glycosyltransferase